MIDLKLLSSLIDEALDRQTTESVDAFFAAYPDEKPETDLEKQVTGFMGMPTNVTSYQDWNTSFKTPCADARVKNIELLSSLVPEDGFFEMAA